MRVRPVLVLLLLLALAAPAAAVPLLPMEFSGSVTIDGSPAPAGTVVTARINGSDCGSLALTTAGAYGGDALFDERLVVCGEDGDAQKTIAFFVDGALAAGTAVYTPGASTRLDLTTTKVKGDFNNNGRVDIGDVSRVAYMVVGKEAADPAADFNENGAVDIGDAAKIAYYFVEKIPAL
jgi:hypothetical protein